MSRGMWMLAAIFVSTSLALALFVGIVAVRTPGVSRAVQVLVVASALFPIVVVGGIFAGIARAARGTLAEVDVSASGEMVIRPVGGNRFLALRRDVRVDPGEIESVRIVEDCSTIPIGGRLPGTYLPGVLIAGSYGTGEDRGFWLARPNHRVVELTLRGHAYRRVVVEVDDPSSVVSEIRAVGSRPSSEQPQGR